MRANRSDTEGVHALARELGARYTLDPTITPMMDGNTSVLRLRVDANEISGYFDNPDLVGNAEKFCAPLSPVDEDVLEGSLQRRTHFLLRLALRRRLSLRAVSAHVREPPEQKFLDIWQHSPQLTEVRSIRAEDLTICSSCSHAGTCTRCPGLAYMEGNMRGPSSADCEKSFVRTGIVTAGMMAKEARSAGASGLVQIEL